MTNRDVIVRLDNKASVKFLQVVLLKRTTKNQLCYALQLSVSYHEYHAVILPVNNCKTH